jgi:predicted nucleic acid-binding protein
MIVADSNLIAYLLIPGDKSALADEVLLWRSREFAIPSDDVLGLTSQHNITAYDGEFVVLAQQLGVPFVTFDKPVRVAFPNIAIGA